MKKLLLSVFNVSASALVYLVFGKSDKYGRSTGKFFGRSYILRKRKHLQRSPSYFKGECFNSMHCGLWAFSLEHKQGRGVYFKAIKDDQGSETIVR